MTSKSKSARKLIDIIEELNKQTDQLNNFVTSLNEDIKEQLNERISNILPCLDDLRKTHTNINNEFYQHEIKSLETEKLREEKQQLQIQLDDNIQIHVEMLRESSEKEKNWNEQKSELMNDIHKVEENNKLLNDKVVSLTNANKAYLEKITALEKNLPQSHNKTEEFEKQLKQLRTEKDILQKENEALKINLKTYLEGDKSQKNNLHKKTDEIGDTTTHTIEKLNGMLREKNEELENLRKQLESLRNSSNTIKSEYEQLKKEYSEIKALLAQKNKKNSAEIENLNNKKQNKSETKVKHDKLSTDDKQNTKPLSSASKKASTVLKENDNTDSGSTYDLLDIRSDDCQEVEQVVDNSYSKLCSCEPICKWSDKYEQKGSHERKPGEVLEEQDIIDSDDSE